MKKMKKIQVTESQYRKIKNYMIESEILKEQSKTEVMDIQTRLNKHFNTGLKVDGIAGPMTKQAIKQHLGIDI
jgi:peptidoglycan hydrolase-like protein with peptidoglycan-binding domain